MKEEAKDKCDPRVLPRQQQPPKRLNDGAANHAFQSMEDLYTREYFEAIDKAEKRFTQQNFLFVRSVEALLIDSANGKPVAITT